MKLLLSTLGPAALLLAPAFAHAQDQLYTATRQQLDATKTLIAQENAWNKGDMAGYLAFYKDAPDTVAMLAGPARGLENIRAGFLTNFSNPSIMGELEESNVEARAMGDNFTLVTGSYHITRNKKSGGDLTGTFTDILEKTDKGWKIIFSETT